MTEAFWGKKICRLVRHRRFLSTWCSFLYSLSDYVYQLKLHLFQYNWSFHPYRFKNFKLSFLVVNTVFLLRWGIGLSKPLYFIRVTNTNTGWRHTHITAPCLELEFNIPVSEWRKISKNWQILKLLLLAFVLFSLLCGRYELNSVFQSSKKGYYFTIKEKVWTCFCAFCTSTSVASSNYF